MRTGREIRKNKLESKIKKYNTVRDDQKDLVRFVEIRWEVIERINGKYLRTHSETGKGLQVKNRVYLTNGHYKLINSKSVKLLKSYNIIPSWATDELVALMEETKA